MLLYINKQTFKNCFSIFLFSKQSQHISYCIEVVPESSGYPHQLVHSEARYTGYNLRYLTAHKMLVLIN